MKSATIFHPALRLLIIPLLLSSLLWIPQHVRAEENVYQSPSGKFSHEELSQMLAPVALYPDVLLSQILMASTYPIEVIEADRWVRKNPDLKGDALDEALLKRDWDPSVKAICHFPSILALMSERISETTNLGNAFLAQEDDVMKVVQELRAKAYERGYLATNDEQKVIVKKETIIIEPIDPRIIYVPYYDPYYVYDPWWYPSYPPYYWGPTGVNLGVGISYWPGFYFSFSFGSWSYFDWHQHVIYIDSHKRPRFVQSDRWIKKPGRWEHTPVHRRGVAYRDRSTAIRYGQSPPRPFSFPRDIRGFPDGFDQQHLRREPLRREPERTTPSTPIREQFERKQREEQRIDRDKPMRDRQERVKTEPVRHEHQEKIRDNVFNRVEEGERERLSGERGRSSRQERRDDFRGKERREDDGRDERQRHGR